MELVSNIKTRINELMNIYDVTQSDMVKKTGIHKTSLSCYVSGARTPGKVPLKTIADSYNVSIDWLMGYDVPMTRTEDDTDIFLSKYSKLKPEDRAIVDALVERMLNI